MNIHVIHVCVISETFRSLKDDPVVELKERQQATALASVCAVTIAMRHEHENDKYSNGFCVVGGISSYLFHVHPRLLAESSGCESRSNNPRSRWKTRRTTHIKSVQKCQRFIRHRATAKL